MSKYLIRDDEYFYYNFHSNKFHSSLKNFAYHQYSVEMFLEVLPKTIHGGVCECV